MTTCEHIMRKDVRVGFEHISAHNLAEVMETAGVGAIPIVESSEMNKLVGLVTDRDIVTRVVAKGLDPASTRAKDFMTSKIIVCGIETPIEDVLALMMNNQIRRLPVIDEENALVGIISIADIVAHLGPSISSSRMLKDLVFEPDFEEVRICEEGCIAERMGELGSLIDSLMLRARVKAEAAKRAETEKSLELAEELRRQQHDLEGLFRELRSADDAEWREHKSVFERTYCNLNHRVREVLKSWSGSSSVQSVNS